MAPGDLRPPDEPDSAERVRWAAVLGIVLSTTVVVTVVPAGVATLLLGGLVAALVVTIVWETEVVPRGLRIANLAAAVPAVALSVLDAATTDDVLTGWRNVALTVVLATATVAVLHRIAQHRVITLATVFGAVDAYVLLGITFGAAYGAIDALGGELFANVEPSGFDLTYFSFITLTTVGYGDLTPASDLARSVAVVQALLGQVFLVVLVARTVSLIGQERPAAGPHR